MSCNTKLIIYLCFDNLLLKTPVDFVISLEGYKKTFTGECLLGNIFHNISLLHYPCVTFNTISTKSVIAISGSTDHNGANIKMNNIVSWRPRFDF